MAEVYLTPEGRKQLEEKLNYLKSEVRAKIADRLAEARAQGDLSENAEWDSAKEDRNKNEYEIAEIETMLKNAIIVDPSSANGAVIVGSTVHIHNKTRNKDVTYRIVGASEADPLKGRISHDSPIGSALLGHRVGETIVASTPGGEVTLEIKEIDN